MSPDDRVTYRHDPSYGIGIVVRCEPNGLVRVRFADVDHEGEFGEPELEPVPASVKVSA